VRASIATIAEERLYGRISRPIARPSRRLSKGFNRDGSITREQIDLLVEALVDLFPSA